MPKSDCQVLALEPYYGGSHRAFLDHVVQQSRHAWHVIGQPARHWKWRMRNAPLAMAIETANQVQTGELHMSVHDSPPGLIFCSSMLDLPQWRGFLMSPPSLPTALTSTQHAQLRSLAAFPAVVYFHENQWTYPTSPKAREDAHFGYTNLLTALAADEVWFNSKFHQQSFLQASQQFVRRMPDHRHAHALEHLPSRCRVVPPGFNPQTRSVSSSGQSQPITLGWVSRWEHDKRPDQFLALLRKLRHSGLAFELILLGERHTNGEPSLDLICEEFAPFIRHNGFAATAAEYAAWLRQMDMVISTADHEFFGIAICEAVSAGALPIVPDRLSYPELFDAACRYQTLEQAQEHILRFASVQQRSALWARCVEKITPLSLSRITNKIDSALASLVSH